MKATSKTRHVPLWAALLATAAVAALSAALIARQGRVAVELHSRSALLEAENTELRARATQLERENDLLRDGFGIPKPEQAPVRPAPQRQDLALLDQIRMLTNVQDKLATANKAIEDFQSRILDLESSIAKLGEENKRLIEAERDLREQLAKGAQTLDVLQAELKIKTERAAQLEAANLVLSRDSRTATEKTSQLSQDLAELEEINRRRELALANVLRRYRDINDQYRTIALRIESHRSGQSGDTTEFSRIQAAVADAEEELRDLTTLNAQAARLHQRLRKK